MGLTWGWWCQQSTGGFTTRPYGMKLYLPGASRFFHWPSGDSALWELGSNDTGVRLFPNDATDTIKVKYEAGTPGQPGHKIYPPGAVAYLQIEDKTWYVFEWATGDLLEIIKPDGQRLTFLKQNEANILVRDFAGREVKINRDPQTKRINTLTDPVGNQVRYEYDDYGNLSTVTDRTGRARFYIYDTPETKADPLFADRDDLTGFNPHHLVDVRIDDDSDNIANWANDTLSDSEDERIQGINAAYQNYPGDTSILKVEYDSNGLMIGMETSAGSVELDHQFNDDDAGGTEVVRDATTGSETHVTYEEGNRVKNVTDAWGNTTRNEYGESSENEENGTIQNVLMSQTDAMGNTTEFDYEAPERNFIAVDAIVNYIGGKWNNDLDPSGKEVNVGYLTGNQAQPTKITQYLNENTPINTEIEYAYQTVDPDEDPVNLPHAFQPSVVKDPLGNRTNLNYDEFTGKMTSLSFTGRNGLETEDGATITNDYYDATETMHEAVRLSKIPPSSVVSLPPKRKPPQTLLNAKRGMAIASSHSKTAVTAKNMPSSMSIVGKSQRPRTTRSVRWFAAKTVAEKFPPLSTTAKAAC